MRLPVIPIAVMVVLLGGGTILVLTLTGPGPTRSLEAPQLSRLLDVDGIETEVAIAPDGMRYALIASGDLWFVDLATSGRQQLTRSPEPETAPAWTPDGGTITFTRGTDTFALAPGREETIERNNAAHMDWSPGGRVAFVRDRALWVGESRDAEARELVPADPDPMVNIHSVRFSPSGDRIVFLKTKSGFRGEVWIADYTAGAPTPLIADRVAENPTSADWIDERRLAYLTDRSGGLAVWYIDIPGETFLPLTPPMMGRALAPLGLAVLGERIVLPRHFVDADIRTTSGRAVTDTPRLELDPAVSPDGEWIAYTVEDEGRFELWMVRTDGAEPRYVTLGQNPRFSPDGNHLVYSRADLDGNRDIWKVDVRTGVPARLTDDPGLDMTPDWSPDGRTIIFASERGGGLSLWTIPSAGGRRLQWRSDGYAPRFSPDGRRVAFWSASALWTAAADGSEAMRVAEVEEPAFAAWTPDSSRLAYVEGRTLGGAAAVDGTFPVWPVLDAIANGEWLVAALEAERTEVWEIQLQFNEE